MHFVVWLSKLIANSTRLYSTKKGEGELNEKNRKKDIIALHFTYPRWIVHSRHGMNIHMTCSNERERLIKKEH